MNRSVPYEQALSILIDSAATLGPVVMSLDAAIGHVTAQPTISTEMSPNANVAAMDGFAIRASDTTLNDTRAMTKLCIIASSEAGNPTPATLAYVENSAISISTGALLPSGYDSVVPFEKVIIEGNWLKVSRNLPKGQNVRIMGEDHQVGDIVLDARQQIAQQHVLLLSNVGCTRINVIRKPRVLVIATGTEIEPNQTESLQSGYVHNSNSRYLASALQQMGCERLESLTIPDNKIILRQAFENALYAEPSVDVIITIGGVSRGTADFVPDVISQVGGNFLFRGVNLRPGKPVLSSRFRDKPTLHFGLPGNPLAVLTTFRALVTPYLQILKGLPPELPQKNLLGNEIQQDPKLTRFLLAKFSKKNIENSKMVFPINNQKASQVSGLRYANCWLIVPPGIELIPSGARIGTLLL